MSFRRGAWAARLVLGAVLAFGAAARAEQAAPWGYELADELMSPWCPGFALPDCSSGYASDLRLWILEQEKLGRAREDVKAEILARYGERMLQAPKPEGRGLLAYAIPAALILLGGGILFAFLRSQRPASGVSNSPPNPPLADTQLLSRVDAELAAYESSNPVE